MGKLQAFHYFYNARQLAGLVVLFTGAAIVPTQMTPQTSRIEIPSLGPDLCCTHATQAGVKTASIFNRRAM